MICPRCKKEHNILAYVPLMEIEEFQEETNPIYKCPSCRWMFSPAIFNPSDKITNLFVSSDQ